MRKAERQTRSFLMGLFNEKGMNPRTDLGQNFLIDLNLIEFVVEQAELGPNDVVLEIGTGTGGMTVYLAQQAAGVVSVEVDHRVFELAKEFTSAYENITLLNCDALKGKNNFAPEVLAAVRAKLAEDPQRQLKLVANLPYCIGTPVISNLVATDLPWVKMVVTLQLELAERMQAKPGTDEYGSLSAWLQSQCKVKILKRLGPTVFWPRPKVDSAVIRLMPEPERQAKIVDREFYHDFVRRTFNQRRKHLRGVLAGMYRKQLAKTDIDDALASLGLAADIRAEDVPVATLVQLSNAVRAKMPEPEPVAV